MAMKCKKTKDIIKDKRNQVNARQNMTYSNVTQATIPTQMPKYNMPLITKEEILQIHACVAHAQNKNLQNPGTYAMELNRTLKANNLPTIIIPEDLETNDSQVYTTQQTGATASEVTQTAVPEKEKVKPTASRRNSIGTPQQSNESTTYESTTHKITAAELGLEFYTPMSKRWPKNFSTTALTEEIRKGKIKWKYTNENYTEKGEILLTGCWYSLDNDLYQKMRSGFEKEHSPVAEEPRHKKKH